VTTSLRYRSPGSLQLLLAGSRCGSTIRRESLERVSSGASAGLSLAGPAGPPMAAVATAINKSKSSDVMSTWLSCPGKLIYSCIGIDSPHADSRFRARCKLPLLPRLGGKASVFPDAIGCRGGRWLSAKSARQTGRRQGAIAHSSALGGTKSTSPAFGFVFARLGRGRLLS
jgi:hypothetical protein